MKCVRAKNKKEIATHAWVISHARTLDHRVNPTSELVIYAVSGPGKQPS